MTALRYSEENSRVTSQVYLELSTLFYNIPTITVVDEHVDIQVLLRVKEKTGYRTDRARITQQIKEELHG